MASSKEDAVLYEKAVTWVVTHMQGKFRKGGDRPMLVHSIRVGSYLDQAGLPIEVVVAGFLHDLLEDTPVTEEEIEHAFGSQILAIVKACSHDNALHERDRQAANEELFERAFAYGPSAVVIKVADAADNIATIHHLAKDRQMDFMHRAERWLAIGRHVLLPRHPLVTKLARRIKRAKTAI